MTKKDYIRLARAINKAYRYENRPDVSVAIAGLATLIGDELKEDNSRFDFGKFLKAALERE